MTQTRKGCRIFAIYEKDRDRFGCMRFQDVVALPSHFTPTNAKYFLAGRGDIDFEKHWITYH